MSCSPGTVCSSVVRKLRQAVCCAQIELRRFGQMRDVAGVDRQRGLLGIAFTRAMVRVSVPSTSGLASLLKPMCVSLICTNSGLPSCVLPGSRSAALRQIHRRQDAAGQQEQRARSAIGQAFERVAARLQEVSFDTVSP